MSAAKAVASGVSAGGAYRWKGGAPLAATVVGAAMTLAVATASAEIALNERRSSYLEMSETTQAMQDDDTANPGMLWVLDGEALWRAAAGQAGRACADCHGEADQSMAGVAARYPAWNDQRGQAVNLEGRINMCRMEQQGAPAMRPESRELLALTAYLAHRSRGRVIDNSDPRLKATIEQGRSLFFRRQGQLDLACAHCHDDNWGQQLAGNRIPQGHPTGYPLYRLEWQTLGSLQRRLRNCMIGMRAESYAFGSPEFLALEAYLMWRARGMAIESPAVRP
jgi:sulfur-oxidizing protein SoxA